MQLKPETEQLVHEEISSGHFQSVDELIVEGVHAWREKHQVSQPGHTRVRRRPERTKSLAQLFAESPFKGLSMNFERFSDTLPRRRTSSDNSLMSAAVRIDELSIASRRGDHRY